ncbi:hypothetical protein HGRIS_004555 [Hohenbuehelia grisea]|uniref:Uncharacterized protein n=1 Tax=Hohenbuehelia grisea TaxID=104357 RepID=A0ABR3JDG2_9AGAR
MPDNTMLFNCIDIFQIVGRSIDVAARTVDVCRPQTRAALLKRAVEGAEAAWRCAEELELYNDTDSRGIKLALAKIKHRASVLQQEVIELRWSVGREFRGVFKGVSWALWKCQRDADHLRQRIEIAVERHRQSTVSLRPSVH